MKNRINSVPWMNAVTPTPYHECTQLVPKKFSDYTEWKWLDGVDKLRSFMVRYGVGLTAVIHVTELMWPHSFMIRSWCDRVKPWYGVDVTAFIPGTELMRFGMRWCDSAKSLNVVSVYTVHCTVGFICAKKIRKFILRSQKNQSQWLQYTVKIF